MAHLTLQPQLRRHLSLFLLVGLGWLEAVSAATSPPPVVGAGRFDAGFFLLSDQSFGSADTAKVRVEAQSLEAIADHGGLDMAIYKVPNPVTFLGSQRDLHRISIKPQPAGEGVWNAVMVVWDKLAVEARLRWRKVFSSQAREAVTQTSPSLKAKDNWLKPTPLAQAPGYKALPGLTLVDRFRYPVHVAFDIAPPQALLAGANVDNPVASDDAAQRRRVNGNVYIPLGKLAPGLYVIEASLSEERALALVFVSDTVSVTKTSAEQMVVWTVHRLTGAPVPGAVAQWTDGLGTLGKGTTDSQGLVTLKKRAPEKTYVYGVDPSGGAFVSENFYYDSEIYNTKLYATTDRPLYRPGDEVKVKLMGREFVTANQSVIAKDAPVELAVTDPGGQVVAKQTFSFSGLKGGQTQFTLPEQAVAGGYDLQLTYRGEPYGAAFRVAQYLKPHFEIVFKPQKNYRTRQPVQGQLQLRYPDGKPVVDAKVQLTLRAQTLSMVEGELGYTGLFPVKLSTDTLTSDANGHVLLDLPAATAPSRYTLSVLVNDGAAAYVRGNYELLIERAAATWKIESTQRFSTPKSAVAFALSPAGSDGTVTLAAETPATWEWIRLEDRRTQTGSVTRADGFSITFDQAGSYALQVKNKAGDVVGGSSHWVSGEGLKVAPGHIEIVWNQHQYQPGDTATALITFSEPVQHALLTLERDRVEQAGLLSGRSAWSKSEQVGPRQWRVSVPIQPDMAPNITFSVAAVKNGQFVFENAGIQVKSTPIDIQLRYNKAQYMPGETASLTITTTRAKKAVPAEVSLSVVDEMIYVLQPEIAPSIQDFFYHPRRNNVRTQASLSFIGFDLSTNQLGQLPTRSAVHDRAVKVLERPRRDNIDTAAWFPSITTDANGQAQVSFKIPQGLTRWRTTARAMDSSGTVGQSTAYFLSDKPWFLKWTAPDWQRPGDQSGAKVAVFNQTGTTQTGVIGIGGMGTKALTVTLAPGVNYVSLPWSGKITGPLGIALQVGTQLQDTLEVPLRSVPLEWRQPISRMVLLADTDPRNLALQLPADAQSVSLRLMTEPQAQVRRVADDLIDYPYGCVEQTASRLIPLAIAYRSLSPNDPRLTEIKRLLFDNRQRLVSMAGPQAQFGWWGANMTPDPFLTGYAYYADWLTAKALGLQLPESHWKNLLQVYAKGAATMSRWQRALVLDWMQQMGLPVRNMVEGLANEWTLKFQGVALEAGRLEESDVLGSGVNTQDAGAGMVLLRLQKRLNISPTARFDAQLQKAQALLTGAQNEGFVQVLMGYGLQGPGAPLSRWLDALPPYGATIDRALMLVWMVGSEDVSATSTSYWKTPAPIKLPAPWISQITDLGDQQFVLPAYAETRSLPLKVDLSALPRNGQTMAVQIDYTTASSKDLKPLPVSLSRKLYRITPLGGDDYQRQEVGPQETLKTNALYLEELTLTPQPGLPLGSLSYVVAEMPLVPGASTESSAGFVIKGQGNLPAGSTQVMFDRYLAPLGAIKGVTKVQQLLRFSQPGQYRTPPVRVYNMYQPQQQARWANPQPVMVE